MAGQQKTGNKKGALGAFFRMWCEWRDSNPQGSRRQILSLLCIPIPPHSHA